MRENYSGLILAIIPLAVAVGYGIRWLRNLNFLKSNSWSFDALERQNPNLSVNMPDTGKQVSRRTRFFVYDPLVIVFCILFGIAIIFAEGI